MRRSILCVTVVGALLMCARASGAEIDPRTRDAKRWKINTHLFAANKALADALHDGKVTIPPYGEFPIAASALRALKAEPAAYRAGVLAPDLFPDMYVGGWVLHSDTPKEWNADLCMRHVWSTARRWQDAGERDKVLAFAYGYLTHGAGDMFAHTYVNQKADGAWVSFTGRDRSTAVKHVVLEGYIGAHTPDTDLSLDVWPRLVAEVLIKSPAARQHMPVARHYQRWLELYDWLGPQIEKARKQMNNNVNDDAPYWMKCAHAIGEGMSELAEFSEWVGDPMAPINAAIMAEVKQFMQKEFPEYYQMYEMGKDPATQMDNVDFPAGTRQLVDREMGITSGQEHFDWRAFEPMYNAIIMSKLILLDGDGLTELARRAGITGPLFAPGEDTNVMLGVFKSMTHSYQWTGEVIPAETRFGICGPEDGEPLPPAAQCGINGRDPTPGTKAATLANATTTLSGGRGLRGCSRIPRIGPCGAIPPLQEQQPLPSSCARRVVGTRNDQR